MPNKKGMKPERLRRIKELIDLFADGPLTQPEIGGITGLSNSGIRKNMAILVEAKVLDVKKVHVLEPRIFSLTKDTQLLQSFIHNMEEQIKLYESSIKVRKEKEETQVVIGIRFAHHQVAPGRTIYRALDDNG